MDKNQLTPGRELISTERQDQLLRHGYTIEDDVIFNSKNQLAIAAATLLTYDGDEKVLETPPLGWNKILWKKMLSKPYKERVATSGALAAAEIDRISAMEIDRMVN